MQIDRHETRDCALLLIAVLACLGMVAKWNLHQISVWQSNNMENVR